MHKGVKDARFAWYLNLIVAFGVEEVMFECLFCSEPLGGIYFEHLMQKV